MEVTFPDGTMVRACGLARRDDNRDWRSFGLYLDARWQPDWQAEVIDWVDFGLPREPDDAARAIRAAFNRAREGERIEIGCVGGLGRTGTVLACMATLAGVPAGDAVAWVRAHYAEEAVETAEQESWVLWFATHKPDR
ncbi:MAG TPA: protein-tyrosine phosphatase family protein [Nitrolancea sp.]